MKNFSKVLFALVAFVLAASAAFAQQVLTSEFPISNGGFAWDMSACADFLVVGEPGQNSATVYHRNGDALEFFQNISKHASEFGAQFAHTTAIAGNCSAIIFGSPKSDACGGIDSGAIERWKFDDNTQQFVYDANYCGGDTVAGDEIGQAVAINEDGTRMAWASYLKDSVYRWTDNGESGSIGKENLPSGLGSNSYFGFSLCFIGGRLGVGAPLKFNSGQSWFGAFYVDGVPLNPMGNDRFGYECSSFGSDVAVAATLASTTSSPTFESAQTKYQRLKGELDALAEGSSAGQGQGKVLVYHVRSNGSTWLEGTLNSPDSGDDEFGTGLGMWEGWLSVGAPYHAIGDVTDAGITHAFQRTLAGWQLKGHVQDDTPETLDRAGWSAAMMPELGIGSSPFSDEVGTDAGVALTVLTRELSDNIFDDGFESGDTAHWSASVQ